MLLTTALPSNTAVLGDPVLTDSGDLGLTSSTRSYDGTSPRARRSASTWPFKLFLPSPEAMRPKDRVLPLPSSTLPAPLAPRALASKTPSNPLSGAGDRLNQLVDVGLQPRGEQEPQVHRAGHLRRGGRTPDGRSPDRPWSPSPPPTGAPAYDVAPSASPTARDGSFGDVARYHRRRRCRRLGLSAGRLGGRRPEPVR